MPNLIPQFIYRKPGFVSLLILLSLARNVSAAEIPKPTPDLIAKGKVFYSRECTTCHGEKGDGTGKAAQYENPRPRDFLIDEFKHGSAPQNVFDSISKGIPGTSMSGFDRLSVSERWALAFYVLSLRKNKDKK